MLGVPAAQDLRLAGLVQPFAGVLAEQLQQAVAQLLRGRLRLHQRLVAERIAPVAKVAVAGQDNAVLNAGDTTPTAPPPVAPATVLSGEQVYNTTCIACHAAGVAGAPKFGDKGAWAPRLGQGLAVLHKHALEGFQGKAGVMPPKGGRVDLADQSILNAVEYMVNAAK